MPTTQTLQKRSHWIRSTAVYTLQMTVTFTLAIFLMQWISRLP